MSSHIYLILSTIFLSPVLLLILIKRTKKTAEARKLPPGPRKLPLIGNLHQLGRLPHRSFERLSKDHGPIMLLQLGFIPTVVISSAEVAREIFRSHDLVFSSRPIMYSATKISYSCNDISFAPYGDVWKELRKISKLELLNPIRVLSFEAARDNEVGSMIDSITSFASRNLLINVSEMMTLLASNVICRIAFGQRSGGRWEKEKSEFHEMIRDAVQLLGGFCVSDFFPWMGWLNKLSGLEYRLEKSFREVDKFCDAVLEYHHLDDPKGNKLENEDFVHVLLRLQKDPNQPIAITNDQIKGVLMDLFLAGTDTSANTLTWAMTELARHPLLMKRAQDEVREIAKGKRKVEESQISKLVYLKLVVKETLRLHPPLPLLIPRETMDNCVVAGYDIPAKTWVFVNAKAIATDPTFWEKPYEFWPERFLDSSVNFRGQSFEFLPFGAGRRGCPGIDFALPLIELALANLLCCFDWTLPHGMKEEDIDMEEEFGLAVHKKIPLSLVATCANLHSH